jgi:cytochrome c oxidase subunit 2
MPERESMKKNAIVVRLCVSTAVALLLFLGVSPTRTALAQDQNVQVIEVTAKKYEFSPSPIRVKAGTKVQLKITAVDHDHGFKVSVVPEGGKSGDKPGLVFSSPQDCLQLKKGQTTTIEFVAQTPGTYEFHCCHVCGLGHKKMKSEIVVE